MKAVAGRKINAVFMVSATLFDSLAIGGPETRVFILVALARVNVSYWFNIMTRLASFYRK